MLVLNTHYDFLRYRRLWVLVSIFLIAIGVGEVFFGGPLNYGIDLAGGHQLNVVFRDPVSSTDVRASLNQAGLAATVQPFGDDHERSFLIRLSLLPGDDRDATSEAVAALSALFPEVTGSQGRRLDLNRTGVAALATWLAERDPAVVAGNTPRADAERILLQELAPFADARRERGLIRDWAELEAAGLDPGILAQLESGTTLGGFSIVGQETVGPQIGSELRTRALLAVVLSIVGMLLYIWWRFELPYAVGAVVATLHDVAVVGGLYALAGFEINLTTVAALLTLVGYSVNDTVVVFDRVRENRRAQPRTSVLEVMNRSLNQTLTRTVMTSGTTLLAAGSLLVFGGDVLRGFSFVLVVGVIVGTYSSVYIASPVALLFFERRERHRRRRGRPIAPRPIATAA